MPKRTPRKKVNRPGPIRESYDRVLIVCEGSRTEPYYIENLCRYYRLSTANIEVLGLGNDPLSLVNRALTLAKVERKKLDGYDAVYCMFDRDTHTSFDNASSKAMLNQIRLARSWPCFEYWILLHYHYTRKPYVSSGGKSAADNCVADLRKHDTSYTKGAKGLFVKLLPYLGAAKANAEKALKDADHTEQDNPSTEVHKLVEYLQCIKKERV